jgi:hypothetical protein
VRLTLATAETRLLLPHRPPAPEDAALAPFPPPEAAPPLPCTALTPAVQLRRFVQDQIGGEATLEVHDDTGRYRIETTGLDYRLASVEHYAIGAEDPLSARAEMVFEMQNGRGDWQTRAVTRTVLRASRSEFLVDATLDAWEGERRVAARSWQAAVPRHGV